MERIRHDKEPHACIFCGHTKPISPTVNTLGAIGWSQVFPRDSTLRTIPNALKPLVQERIIGLAACQSTCMTGNSEVIGQSQDHCRGRDDHH